MAKVNPNNHDYDKDGIPGTRSDVALGKQDLNRDGNISQEERRKAQAPKAQTSRSVTTFRDGQPVETVTTTPMAEQATEQGPSALTYGVSQEAIEAYDLADFIRKMIEEDVTDKEEFFRRLEEHPFGQGRIAAQEAFDIAILGPEKEDLEERIRVKEDSLRRQVLISGVDISDQEIKDFARESVRSNLTDGDTLAFISSRFQMPTTMPGQPQQPVTGQVGDIVEELRNLARSYGITLTETDVQKKAREALSLGGDWKSYIDGQRDVFRQQAKSLYPKIAGLLDTSDLGTIMNPYLSDAAELLGINMSQMQTTDPMWQTALNGENGPLSRDEWLRVLRTDPKYGYDRTVRARQEYTELADELLSAFGMA